MSQWQNIEGTAGGLANFLVNNPPPQAGVAAPGGLTNQYWGQAGTATGAPDVTGFQRGMTDIGSAAINQYVNPSEIYLPGNFNFQPGQLNLPNTFAGGVPTVSNLASAYQVNPQQVSGPTVSAQQVSAPGAIAPIGGLMQVAAPQLQQYQMGPAERVSAMNLRDLQMQAAGNVAPSGLATTQSWTDPGTAAAFMSPYTQQVINTQLAQAQVQNQQQMEAERSQAAAAGAFGGSRQAVEQANREIGYQQLAAGLEAQGLQQAYQQGAQQFNTQQALGQQAQQFNIGTGLQAALANQQVQQQANVQNLSAALQTQGLSAQTGLQAALANQQAGLTVGGQNLAALLGVQQLGAGQQMQASLANQQQGLQTALANQQAQEFSAGQQLQAALANQATNLQSQIATGQFGMQGALANQAAGIQTGLAAQQLGFQGGLANQAANMQALMAQYQAGTQGALQTQNLGFQGQVAGGQLGLQSALQQEQLRQQQQNLNLAGFGQAANIYGQAGQLGLAGYGAGLQGLGALGQAAMGQQGYQQQLLDTAYQNAMMGMMTPLQATAWQAQLLGLQPLPYTTTSTGATTNVTTPPQPGWLQLGLQAGLGALGGLGGLGIFRKGGRVKLARGGRAPAGHADAAQDRQQILQILRQRGIIAPSGLGRLPRRLRRPGPARSELEAPGTAVRRARPEGLGALARR
jgi:hypothetical protein